jgi:hypothetical protein
MLSILTGLLFAVAGGAHANENVKEKEKEKAMAAEPEAQKRLALVNVYIDDAVNHTKALQLLSGLELEKKDAPIINEVQKNLSTSIDSALKHLAHVKKMEGVTGTGELESHLKEAKAAARKISGSKVAELETSIAPVETHLGAASSSFHELAKGMKITLIEDIDLGAAPVRGIEEEQPKPEELPAPAQPTAPPSETRPEY